MKILFLIVFLPTAALCQDLTGVWTGSFARTDRKDEYKLEIQLVQTKEKLQGITFSYRTTEFYAKATTEGTIQNGDGKILLEEKKVLNVRIKKNYFLCYIIFSLTYLKTQDQEILYGTFMSFRDKTAEYCGTGSVFLTKTPNSKFKKEPFLVKQENLANRKEAVQRRQVNLPAQKTNPAAPAVSNIASKTPAFPKPLPRTSRPAIEKTDTTKKDISATKRAGPLIVPKVLITRENELVKTIIVNNNEVTLNIYDNGTIDHDTISVYVDNQLVISRQMVTATPIIMKLSLSNENDYHRVVMVAENQGDIPPNTSLMVIRADDKRYEVRISSTEQKNCLVVFKYEKK